MLRDLIIIGGGPAGLSAAMTARSRGLDTLILSNPPENSRLAKAERIDNYPGFAGVDGKTLLRAFSRSVEELGLELVYGKATAVMPLGAGFMVSVGTDIYEARSLILAAGLAPQVLFEGEAEYLGRGVSYCATCDGMLYRGRKVAVIGLAAEAEKEAQFLRDIGCEAEYFDRKRAKRFRIKGEDRVTALEADSVSYPVDGVFILRDAVRPDALLAGLALDGARIRTDEKLATSIPGVFAAGDCTGGPYQIAKAVGQGNIAALSVSEYLINIAPQAEKPE